MYRALLPVFLLSAAGAAGAPPPQSPGPAADSDVTYVKIQPFDRLTDDGHQHRSPYRESRIEILPLSIPGTVQELKNDGPPEETNRHVRSEVTTFETETTDVTESTTERDERLDELIRQTEEYETRTKAPGPRFLSKLSYFKKTEGRPSVVTNLVEREGKRGFRSKCRCEKIWNCPLEKLQITVPRCENEYFLCCF